MTETDAATIRAMFAAHQAAERRRLALEVRVLRVVLLLLRGVRS